MATPVIKSEAPTIMHQYLPAMQPLIPTSPQPTPNSILQPPSPFTQQYSLFDIHNLMAALSDKQRSPLQPLPSFGLSVSSPEVKYTCTGVSMPDFVVRGFVNLRHC